MHYLPILTDRALAGPRSGGQQGTRLWLPLLPQRATAEPNPERSVRGTMIPLETLFSSTDVPMHNRKMIYSRFLL